MDNLEDNNYEEFEEQEEDRRLKVNTPSPSMITKHTSFLPNKRESILPMIISDSVLEGYNKKVISQKFTNSFNFSKLAAVSGNLNMSIGITSANRREGKTLVASNMAVSLASAYQRSTILVDLNFRNPQLHKIFNAPLEPGVVEAVTLKTVHVCPTAIDNLFLMTAGDCSKFSPGIEKTLLLRELLHTLKKEFNTVIVDMSSMLPISESSVHFVNEIDGLITVVDTKNTKKEALKKVFNHIDEKQFLGYIFNRVNEKT